MQRSISSTPGFGQAVPLTCEPVLRAMCVWRVSGRKRLEVELMLCLFLNRGMGFKPASVNTKILIYSVTFFKMWSMKSVTFVFIAHVILASCLNIWLRIPSLTSFKSFIPGTAPLITCDERSESAAALSPHLSRLNEGCFNLVNHTAIVSMLLSIFIVTANITEAGCLTEPSAVVVVRHVWFFTL